jgi:hypothetical protein
MRRYTAPEVPSEIEQRRALFLAAARPYTTYHVATALSNLTPGVNWRGCGKKEMADQFANETYAGLCRLKMPRFRLELARVAHEISEKDLPKDYAERVLRVVISSDSDDKIQMFRSDFWLMMVDAPTVLDADVMVTVDELRGP